MTKLGFKQAFVFLTGMIPTKEDMKVIKSYLEASGVKEFVVQYPDFVKIMTLYL